MVFNVLWLTAVAAAAALAGFCMGRLSMQTGESAPEEEEAELTGQRRGVWEVEAAGEWNVQVDGSILESGGESPWIRMADRAGRQSVAERGTGARTVSGAQRAPVSMAGSGSDTAGESSQLGAAGRWISGVESIRRNVNSRYLRTGRRVRGGREQQVPMGPGRAVGSPVTGLVVSYREGDHPAVLISPLEDKLYAPANGKITKLFPMGNAFLFRTEFGTELYIQAGDVQDDLLGRYFRPRVVQNEIVSKGKLLLEFDRLGLKAEGATFAVTVRVENHTYGSNVTMTAQEQVRPGEEIMRVQEKYFPEKNFMEK